LLDHKVCVRCLINSTVPGVRFDESGVCNYCKLHDILENSWKTGEAGKETLNIIADQIKKSGRNKRYDCIIGVSGGTDSTYLLYLAKQMDLRPLAVNFDNGWNSLIANDNIKKAVSLLGIDLKTYIVDWEEFKDILLSFLYASLPWPDAPTDIAITSILYKTAAQEGIKYIIVGNNFRTEGKMPTEWTYCDGRTIRYVQKRFGSHPIKTFPNLTLSKFAYYSVIKRIKLLRILNFIDYHKDDTRTLLEKELGWSYYGGHHYESIYTRFAYSYILPRKFGIDKRIITHSALVRSGEISREEGLKRLQEEPYDKDKLIDDLEYVIKKLGLTTDKFDKIMTLPPKSFLDYPSYYPIFQKMLPLIRFAFKYALPWTPPMFHEIDVRKG
jgi:N-acetyl sugar amidotransferase